MAGEMQGHQTLIEKAHDSFHSKERDSLNTKFDLLERFLDAPFRVTFASPVVTIGTSDIVMTESNGAQGELSDTADIFTVSPQPDVSHEVIGQSTLNILTGVATGSFESVAPFCPVIPANNYIWIGVEMIGNLWFVRWGLPSATLGGATKVTFSNLAKRKLFTALLQKDAVSGTWGLTADVTDFIVFEAGGAGGSGGAIGEGGDDYLVTRYKMNFRDGFETSDFIDDTQTTGEFTFIDQGKVNLDWSIRSFTKSGNDLTLSVAPSYTMKVGDVVRQGTVWTTITVVTSQVLVTVANAGYLVDGKATFTQCITTRDLMQQDTALYNVDKSDIVNMAVKYTDYRNLFCRRSLAFVAGTKQNVWSAITSNPPNTYVNPIAEVVVDSANAAAQLFTRFFSNASFDGTPVSTTATAPTAVKVAYSWLAQNACAVYEDSNSLYLTWYDVEKLDTIATQTIADAAAPTITYSAYRDEYALVFVEVSSGKLARRLYYSTGTPKGNIVYLDTSGGTGLTATKAGRTIYDEDHKRYITVYEKAGSIWYVDHTYGTNVGTAQQLYDGAIIPATLPRILRNVHLDRYIITFYANNSLSMAKIDMELNIDLVPTVIKTPVAGIIDHEPIYNILLQTYGWVYATSTTVKALQVSDVTLISEYTLETAAIVAISWQLNTDLNNYVLAFVSAGSVIVNTFDARAFTEVLGETTIATAGVDCDISIDQTHGQMYLKYLNGTAVRTTILNADGNVFSATGTTDLFDYKVYFHLEEALYGDFHWQAAISSDNTNPQGDSILLVSRNYNATGRTLISGIPTFNQSTNIGKPIRDFFINIDGKLLRAGANNDYIIWNSNSILLTYDLPLTVQPIIVWRNRASRDDSEYNRNVLDALVDVVVSDLPETNFFDIMQDAIDNCPTNGWILVDKLCVLKAPVLVNKQVNILCRGQDTGFLADPGTDEVQKVSFSVTPNAGNFQLVYNGTPTVSLLFSATYADVRAALETILGVGNVSVSGGFANGFTITFTNAAGKQNHPQMTYVNNLTSSGSPITIAINTTTGGVAPYSGIGLDVSQANCQIIGLGQIKNFLTGIRLTAANQRIEMAFSGNTTPISYDSLLRKEFSIDGSLGLDVDSEDIPFNFDVRLTDRIGFQCYASAYDAVTACPDGGWILVEKLAELATTLDLGVKRINFMCRGEATGFTSTGARVGLKMGANNSMLLGLGELIGFDVAVDLNNKTGTRIEMRFPATADGHIFRETFTTDTSASYSASNALLTYNSATDDLTVTKQVGSSRLFFDGMPLQLGRVYWVKFRAKSAALSGLSLNLNDVAWGTYTDTVNPALSASYQDYEFTLTATANNLYMPIFTCAVGGIGDALTIDDIYIQVSTVNVDYRDLLVGQYNLEGSLGIEQQVLAADVVVSDIRVGDNCYTDVHRAMADVPNNGRILVEKLCVIQDTLTTNGKRVDIVCDGPHTGFSCYLGTNAIQYIAFGAIPDAGTWKLQFGGVKTTDMAFNVNAAAVEAALEALPSITNVAVSGDYSTGFTIEFTGVDGLQPQPLIVIPSGINEIQKLSFATDIGEYEVSTITCPLGNVAGQGDYFILQNAALSFYAVWLAIDGNLTAPTGAAYLSVPLINRIRVDIFSADLASQVAGKVYNAVNGITSGITWSNLGAGVLNSTNSSKGSVTDIARHNSNDTGNGQFTVGVVTQGVDQIFPTSGTFKLLRNGNKTADIPYGATLPTITTALESLPDIGVGDVNVTGDIYAGYTFEFVGALAGIPQNEFTIPEGINEVQRITFSTVPTSGNWRLAFNGQNTINLNWDATTNDIRASLIALSTIDNVLVTGDYSTGFYVEFVGLVDGHKPQLALTLNANTLLTGGTPVLVTLAVTTLGEYPGDNLFGNHATALALSLKDTKADASGFKGNTSIGNTIFVANGANIQAYRPDYYGALALINTYTAGTGNFTDVTTDGTYLFAVTDDNHVMSFTWLSDAFTLMTDYSGVDSYEVATTTTGHLVVGGAGGIRTFSIAPNGSIASTDFTFITAALGMAGVGANVYVAYGATGLYSYAVNPLTGSISVNALHYQSGTYYDVWADSAYLHVAADDRLISYLYGITTGQISYLATYNAPGSEKYRHIWGDIFGYIYASGDSANANLSIFKYTTNYTALTTLALANCTSVYHDGTWLYASTTIDFRSYLFDDSNHIGEAISTTQAGEFPGNYLTNTGSPLSMAVTEPQAGTTAFVGVGVELDQPYCTIKGLGLFENFQTAINLNGKDHARIEAYFSNNVLAIDYTGLTPLDFNVDGSQGSPFKMDDGLFRYDTVISNEQYQGHPYTTYADPQAAIDACPDGGWILVNKMTIITAGLTTSGKTIHFVFRGPETGFDGGNTVATGIIFDAPNCSMTGMGTLQNFTDYAIDFNDLSGACIGMVFGINGANAVNINFGTLLDRDYNIAGSIGLSDAPTWSAQTGFPTGFVESQLANSTLSLDDLTGLMTIQAIGLYTVWVKGIRREFTGTQTIPVPNVSGLYWIWYDSSFELQIDDVPWDLSQDAPVAVVLWNANLGKGKLGDERHGSDRSWTDHRYKHLAFGTQYINGHNISGYTLNTPDDASITFGLTGGRIADEDIFISLSDIAPFTSAFHQNLTDPAQLEIWYRENTPTGDWAWDTATGLPIKHLVGVPQWQDTTSNFAQTPVTDTWFFNVWVLTTNFQHGTSLIIQPQNQYMTQAEAEAEDFDSLQFGGFPAAEMAALYRVTYQYNAASGGTTNCQMVINPLDIRGTRNPGRGAGGGGGGANHNSLSGRSDPNAHPATSTSTEVSEFATTPNESTALNVNTDEVQKSLVKLSDRSDIMTQAARQNANKKLRGGGNITWSGTQLSTVSAMYVEMMGLGDTRNTIQPLTNHAIADGEFIYVTVNRTGVAAANLTVVSAATVPWGDNILVIGRRLGTKLWLENIVLESGQIGNIDLFTTDDKELRFDCVVTDSNVYGTRFATTQAAINACPDGGWILVEKSEALAASLTTGSKRLNFMFRGAATGWTNNGAVTAITATANNNQFIGHGTISGFTNGIDLGATTGNRIDMVFAGNTNAIVGTWDQYDSSGSAGLDQAQVQTGTTQGDMARWDNTNKRYIRSSVINIKDAGWVALTMLASTIATGTELAAGQLGFARIVDAPAIVSRTDTDSVNAMHFRSFHAGATDGSRTGFLFEAYQGVGTNTFLADADTVFQLKNYTRDMWKVLGNASMTYGSSTAADHATTQYTKYGFMNQIINANSGGYAALAARTTHASGGIAVTQYQSQNNSNYWVTGTDSSGSYKIARNTNADLSSNVFQTITDLGAHQFGIPTNTLQHSFYGGTIGFYGAGTVGTDRPSVINVLSQQVNNANSTIVSLGAEPSAGDGYLQLSYGSGGTAPTFFEFRYTTPTPTTLVTGYFDTSGNWVFPVSTSTPLLKVSSGGTAATGIITRATTTWRFGGTVSTITEAGAFSGTNGNFTTNVVTPIIYINRATVPASGISWYNNTYTAWVDYMAQATIAAQGPTGTLTPAASTITVGNTPVASMVISWSRRFFIEDGAGYGFVFESGSNTATVPTIIGEIRSSDGTTRWGKIANTGMHQYHGYGKFVSPSQSAIGGTDYTFDCSAQHIFIKTGTTGTVSYTLGNLSPGQTVNIGVLTTGGARTINWYCSGATMHWNSGVKPTPTTTGSRWDIYTFIRLSDGVVIGVGIMDVSAAGA